MAAIIFPPKLIWATYTSLYAIANKAKFFFAVFFPDAANLATCPCWDDLEAWPPVLEYTSVSKTKILTSSLVAKTWSNPPYPIS